MSSVIFVVLISRRAKKSVKEFFRFGYRFRVKFFRFCVFRGSNLTRSLSESKGVFRYRFLAKFIIRI